MASRQSKLSGSISLDAQAHGIVLLRQDDAHPVAVWPLSAVKKVELVPTEVPQDLNKILSIIIMGPGR